MNDPRPPADSDGADTAQLRRLASNLWWSWHRPVADLLVSLPGAGISAGVDVDAGPDVEAGVGVGLGGHPLGVVDRLGRDDPEALDGWLAAHRRQLAELEGELDELTATAAVSSPEIAYLCPEFGLAAQVPQYSGGLGILAGDHLKAASDLGLPLIGVGLLYRRGFFRQEIVGLSQREWADPVEPEAIGAVDTGARVQVIVAGEAVEVRVWQMAVGSVTLLLLDTDVAGAPPWARAITDRLYGGDRRHRLSQELVLGVGGLRALRALGFRPHVYHLNEGHACFLLLELLAEHRVAGADLDQAIAAVRGSTLFTTHTPVPAGIDRFERDLVRPELAEWVTRVGATTDELLDWATMPSDGPGKPFNTAALAFKLCGRANGVSQLHAGVSRELFAGLGPVAEQIEGVTNGVHARTWVGPELQDLYDRQLGPGWENGDPGAWAKAADLDLEAFRAIRAAGKARLIDLVEHLTGVRLDPGKPVLSFARRFATYKRAALLLCDPDGLAAALEAGAQFVFAGKAHPADTGGKAVLAEIARFAASTSSSALVPASSVSGSVATGGGRIVLVPGYDIDIARVLYQGSDVWLNNPVRPHEACGTSGEKAALNGVLNCSIADGWWADWYTPGIGWVIPTSDQADPDERDRAEAQALHRLLLDEVLPLSDGATGRNGGAGDGRTGGDDGVGSDGRTDRWWAMVTAMLGHLGPKVTAGRMVAEYDERFYRPIVAGTGPKAGA